jgi:hypothetical protein
MADAVIDLPAGTSPPAPAASTPEPAVAAPAPAVAEVVPAVEPAAPIAPAAESGPHDKPTLLEEFTAKQAADAAAAAAKAAEKPAEPAKAAEPVKPAEAKPAEPVKPAEAPKPAEAAPVEPIKYEFKIPESIDINGKPQPLIKADDPRMATFTELLGGARVPPEAAQSMLNMHAEAMQDYAKHVTAEQFRVWNETRDGWRKQIMADEQIGGSGHQTAMQAIARMRDRFASAASPTTPQYAADIKAFDEFLRITGAGDHPIFNRLLHNVARVFDEPQAAEAPINLKPPKGHGRAPKGGIYNHPTSANMDK